LFPHSFVGNKKGADKNPAFLFPQEHLEATYPPRQVAFFFKELFYHFP
jgi:hypothetical protein